MEFTSPLHPATRRRRLTAFFIDHFTITFLMVATVFVSIGPNYLDDEGTSKMLSVMPVVMVIGFALYFAKDSFRGISLGRWIMGIMVRDANNPEQVPSFGKLFVRNLFLILWPVELIVFIVDSNKKRLGDKVSNTVVVENPEKSDRSARILALIGVLVVYAAFVFFFIGAAMKTSDAYKTAVHEIERNKQILTETGGITGYGFMPTGNISISNGVGTANLEIKVIGKNQNVIVNVTMSKENGGVWTIVELR